MNIPSALPSALDAVPATLNVAEVVTLLQRNATRTRRTGHIFITSTLCIRAGILALFLYFTQISAEIASQRTTETYKLVFDQQLRLLDNVQSALARLPTSFSAEKSASPEIQQTVQEALKGAAEQLNRTISESNRALNDELNKSGSSNIIDEIVSTASASVIRIGAVLIAIFLIQIMVVLARYYYRVSDHYSMSAAVIQLSGGKIADIKVLIPLLLPAKIDFGKTPTSPVEKVMDGAFGTIKELSKKIPSR